MSNIAEQENPSDPVPKPARVKPRLFSREWVAENTRHFIIGLVFAVIFAFFAPWAITKCSEMGSAGKVTILVPVQGDARPDAGPDEPYQDKISNDVLHTIRNACLAFEDEHRDIPWLRDNIVFRDYVEGKDKDERIATAEKQIKMAANDGRPVVAVIGHTTSQATLDAAPAYARHQLPVLMPYATRTGIAAEVCQVTSDKERVPRALSFPPSNKVQAKSIAAFLMKPSRGVHSVVLFRDAANHAYSDDCGSELLKILESDTSGPGNTPRVEIVGDIAVGGADGHWYVSQDVVNARADAFVVIAMTKPSLEIVRQVARSDPRGWPKMIVLTDGAIDDNLIPRITPAVKTPDSTINVEGREVAKPFPRVFIAFPESDVQPGGYELVFTTPKAGGKPVTGLSHAAYLADCIYLAYSTAAAILKKGRVKDAPHTFVDALDSSIKWGKNGGSILADALVSKKRAYFFLPTGARDPEAGDSGVVYTLFRINPATVDRPEKQGYDREPN